MPCSMTSIGLCFLGLVLVIWVGCTPADSTDSGAPGGGDAATTDGADNPAPANGSGTKEIEPDATEPEGNGSAEEPITHQPIKPVVDEVPSSISVDDAVVLGETDLTGGIPGEGELTLEQIEAWIDEPANHATLLVNLPVGLDADADKIVGLDVEPMTRAKIELGRQLYFDKRLSADGTVSCADCHHPDEGYGKHTQFGVGIDGQTGDRNSPISYNRILSGPQFWDGRAATLEQQAVGPIENPIEMGNTHEKAVETVKGIPGYVVQFQKVFPDDGVTIDAIGKALATFERAIVTGPSPYDHHQLLEKLKSQYDEAALAALEQDRPGLFVQHQAALEGAGAMTDSAVRGRDLFFSDRVGCAECHSGANFTDERYHNLGVGMDADKPDVGRMKVTGDEADRGAFKTPTLRNVALSAPYMHDGTQETIEDVIEWYVQGGHPNPQLSDEIETIDLDDQETDDLAEFMRALTGAFPQVEQGRLPQ